MHVLICIPSMHSNQAVQFQFSVQVSFPYSIVISIGAEYAIETSAKIAKTQINIFSIKSFLAV